MMDGSNANLWWAAAGVVVALELASGTFYLLMLAMGLVAGALASYAGLGLSGQISVAALLGGGATALWHWRRYRQPQSAPARENRDVNLDIGERIQVTAWGADGATQVAYRGSVWTAKLAAGEPARPGLHQVCAVESNWLVLQPVPPAPNSH
ncbi:NfeD family protein [Ideonella sp.]|uniref:NfeD family protein n=1 Tax=Ideonella sp. TaxID=1929293 RepID=UPI003BB537EA